MRRHIIIAHAVNITAQMFYQRRSPITSCGGAPTPVSTSVSPNLVSSPLRHFTAKTPKLRKRDPPPLTSFESSELLELGDPPAGEGKPVPKVSALTITTHTGTHFEWIDITSQPKADVKMFRAALRKELLSHGVHSTFIKDVNKPLLLPQCSVAGDCIFLTLRGCSITKLNAQAKNAENAPSISNLSNRFTLFLFPKKIISVHRKEIAVIASLKKRWEEKYKDVTREHIVNSFVRRIGVTFEHTVYECSLMFDRYEANLLELNNARRSELSHQIYEIKRRVSIYQRLLTAAHLSYLQYLRFAKVPSEDTFRQDVVQYYTHLETLTEELNQSATELLSLNFQLSAHHLNDLMRVLTIISVFFIPMNFVAAFYGMNFDVLPMLDHEQGWIMCIGLMVFLSVTFGMGFRVMGYLG